MPKYAPASAASTLCALPLLWSIYFGFVYRCDLNRYGHLWSNGRAVAWVTRWELVVTAAGIVVSMMLIPKIARLWTRGKPLTRGEWSAMLIIAGFVGIAIFIAPAAMVDPMARFNALMGNKSGVCLH